MIPALPSVPAPQQSQRWWSRSSSKSLNNDRTSFKPSKKLTNIATAIGLKPKRPLAIQEPPSPILPLHTGDIDGPSVPYGRPPAKSVSTGHSWEDSVGPRTPHSDRHSGRHLSFQQSVLDTNDMDPFAVGAPQYTTSPRKVTDHSRLSVFSDASTSDSHTRRSDPHNRGSFASSSELSHNFPLPSPLLAAEPANSRRASRLTVESEKIVRREPPFLASPVPASPSTPLSHDRFPTSPSSSTLTDKGRLAHNDVPRPKTRPRGKTDAGVPSHRNNSLLSDARRIDADLGPRVVVRQPSINRLQPLQPPFAPPTAGLPPTPLVKDISRAVPNSAASSSSSLSFASSVSSNRDAVANHEFFRPDAQRAKEKPSSAGRLPPSSQPRGRDNAPGHSARPSSSSSRTEFSPTRTLKKAISAQSLHRKPSTPSGMSTPTSPPEDGKFVKKQRSFHHSRIPLPPLPASLRHTNSANSIAPNGGEEVEAKSSPVPVRKRLFSGPSSLRRSTSSQAHSVADDDGRSVFSLPVEDHYTPHSTLPSPMDHSSSSFWDDGLEPPSSPGGATISTSDYTPQHIMAPADMLKLEALVQDGKSTVGFVRSRGDSFTSVSTSLSNTFSDSMSWDLHHSSPPSSLRYSDRFATTGPPVRPGHRMSQQPPARHISLMTRTLGIGSPTSARPSTAQGNMTTPSPDRSSFLVPHTTSPGLPVPPRSRARPATATGASRAPNRASIVPITPLSPPPAWRNGNGSRRTSAAEAPPPRSIMRKPSFLDIDDEAERDKPPDNFLDMGKTSFDTVRSSSDDEDYGLH
ncbi:hypothetical protein FA95DRAFT_1675214 [Auriscalpium vulgare]|uniref:Uncharacterized protein n=1 Tax=Auriscalpium vulgare TaxID=40419 RepID=A0ACB8S7P9_9AGAM|nr:hypothetical protein FA95DRAFT_1675214 [Auriscalpium vulgare]